MTNRQKELIEKTNEELKKVKNNYKLTLAMLCYAINKYLELEKNGN